MAEGGSALSLLRPIHLCPGGPPRQIGSCACSIKGPVAAAQSCSGPPSNDDPPSVLVRPRSARRRYPFAELQQLAVDGMAVMVLLEAQGQLPPAQPVLSLLAFQLAAQHHQPG